MGVRLAQAEGVSQKERKTQWYPLKVAKIQKAVEGLCDFSAQLGSGVTRSPFLLEALFLGAGRVVFVALSESPGDSWAQATSKSVAGRGLGEQGQGPG